VKDVEEDNTQPNMRNEDMIESILEGGVSVWGGGRRGKREYGEGQPKGGGGFDTLKQGGQAPGGGGGTLLRVVPLRRRDGKG